MIMGRDMHDIVHADSFLAFHPDLIMTNFNKIHKRGLDHRFDKMK